jgi:hypothetical protein
MLVYIAKKDTWFDEGTIATLIDDYRKSNVPVDCGLFVGKTWDKEVDEEVCGFDEFICVDTEMK